MGRAMFDNNGLNLKETELRLGLPGRDHDEQQQRRRRQQQQQEVVGWPPVRCYRRNVLTKPESDAGSKTMFVKVSMDGAPYLRKIDLNLYNNYFDLLKALENMFNYIHGCEYAAITYEDKDGDWMLAGDVPWDLFLTCCKRLRIIARDRPRT